MNFRGLVLISAMLACRAEGVVFADNGDPLHNTTSPGDNSGWQYEGNVGDFLGVPIAPHFYITAKHIGGSVGQVFNFHGDSYVTIAFHDSPPTMASATTDLRIWEVDHAKPFPTYSPLSTGVADTGASAAIYGGGAQRGSSVTVSAELKGWEWGNSGYRQRWGRNVVTGTVNGGNDYGELLYCDFDKPGIVDECHLSTGDSGGGLFVLEDGLWRLAGINLSVDGPFRIGPTGPAFYAALFDAGGLEYSNGPTWVFLPDQTENIPSSFYCSRIAASLPWILNVTGQSGSLAPENFSAWQHLYFTPSEITTAATTGPLEDFDGDGVSNLLEFALNLDPSFNERATMVADTGLRGLPLVNVETISGVDHLTLEFVRRTSGSGSGLIYTPQFSTDLDNWQEAGSSTVVGINPRWERVKIMDSVGINSVVRRFARVKVGLAD